MQSLPWDMIGAIVGVLSFVLTLIVEREKLGPWRGFVIALVIGFAVFLIVNLVAPRLFPSQTQAPIIALSDNFDNGDSGYDTSLWECESECSVENISTNNGVLNLKREHEGWSALFSQRSWSYNDLNMLEGKVEINSKSNRSVGVLGISWYGANGVYGQASCDINHGDGFPFILCYFGSQNNREYVTSSFSISPNKQYKVQIKFEKETEIVKYYIDDNLIGEYSARVHPETVKVQMGIYSQNGVSAGLVYIDDVKLSINK